MLSGRFSFFGGGGDSGAVVDNTNSSPSKCGEEQLAVVQPTLKLETDRQVYRPGDPVIVTIQISNPAKGYSFLMERLGFEIRGIEKLDTQWFATQKPMPGSKQKRGEHAFLECSTPVLVANQIVNAGASKSYVVRTQLPSIIPPSYKGSSIRYLYYIKSALTGEWIIYENGQSRAEIKNDVTDLCTVEERPESVSGCPLCFVVPVIVAAMLEMSWPLKEVRIPLQLWINQKSSGFPMDDGSGVVVALVTMVVGWNNGSDDGGSGGEGSSRGMVTNML
ncbi:hypothetical protein D0Y65_017630 [Glycine soja]|uniref:Uncharacterized protein n=1 Tax=Glycine soja TaxID=3848 RepID=A0A445JVV2_GLYSO|nr:hypothetical protein D0Y65_017630 [Glycine soja]RZC02588.1 hypothetical protein D0Y65_017630 [Glycine soja]